MKELDSYPDVTDALPDALAAASPHRVPAELRARVLRAAEIRAGRTSRSLDLRIAFRVLAGAALLVAVIGLGVWNVQLQQALAQDRTLLQQLRDNAGKQPLVFEIVDSTQSQKAMLRTAGPRRPGEDPPYGKLYTNPNFTQIVMMAGRLPDAAGDQAYRLYLTSGTSVIGVDLAVDPSGFAYVVYDSSVRGPTYTSARVYLQVTGARDPGGVLTLSWEGR